MVVSSSSCHGGVPKSLMVSFRENPIWKWMTWGYHCRKPPYRERSIKIWKTHGKTLGRWFTFIQEGQWQASKLQFTGRLMLGTCLWFFSQKTFFVLTEKKWWFTRGSIQEFEWDIHQNFVDIPNANHGAGTLTYTFVYMWWNTPRFLFHTKKKTHMGVSTVMGVSKIYALYRKTLLKQVI